MVDPIMYHRGALTTRLCRASALLDRHELAVKASEVVRGRPDEPVVTELLDDVGYPSGRSAYGKDAGEVLFGNSERMLDRGRVKIHVRPDTLFFEGHGLDVLRYIV